PAVYQADPTGKAFLERFLSIFENVLTRIESKIEDLPRHLDPEGVPETFLSWLASWIDLTFERGWPLAVRPRLLPQAPPRYRRRGTALGLKALLKIVLGQEVRIFEHFRKRRALSLGGAALGGRSELGGACRVPRLQLGDNSHVGSFALIGPGDPLHDPFQADA